MTTTNPNDRLMRILQATPEQLEVIDQVLAGKVPSAAPSTTGPLLLGMAASAKLLGVSRATLWRMMKVGKLERVEVLPGSHRLRRTDVEAIASPCPGPSRTGHEEMKTDAGYRMPDAGLGKETR